MAGGGELADHALGVRPFGDVLDVGGLDLVAEMLDHRLAAELVAVGPAVVADRPDVDEADLERLLGESRPRPSASAARGGGRAGEEACGATDGAS